MEQNKIEYLHGEYLNKSLTIQELKEWKTILVDPKNELLLKNLMKETWEELKITAYKDMSKERSESLFSGITAFPQVTRTHKLWPRMIAAAAVIALIVSGLYFFNYKKNDADLDHALVQEVKPGKVGATLTLANGKKIRLHDAANGTLANEAGISIIKSADGQLVYEIKGKKGDSDRINTLSTAKGETYKVRLPDGSLVYLNAASSLTYVASLNNSGKRIVKLSGEGYFEITKDNAHPFVVKTDKQEVEVLGTHFNINAYADETVIKTSLLEGAVRITSGTMKYLLKPGFQAVNDGRSIKVAEVNMENVVDWKEGDFYFENVDFRSVMRKISRWYDVEVVYDSSLPNTISSNGVISRDRDLSDVLKLIERSGQVKFRIEGKRIFITEQR